VTLFLLRFWPLVLGVAVVATMVVVCHGARALEWLWWHRQDQSGTMRREMKK